MLSPHSSVCDKMEVAPWLSCYGGEKFQLEQPARLPPNAGIANNLCQYVNVQAGADKVSASAGKCR